MNIGKVKLQCNNSENGIKMNIAIVVIDLNQSFVFLHRNIIRDVTGSFVFMCAANPLTHEVFRVSSELEFFNKLGKQLLEKVLRVINVCVIYCELEKHTKIC